MCFFFSFTPATIFTTLSYFVWFAAGKADGKRRDWGNYLAIWLLIVATGFIACGVLVTLAGLCPMERMFESLAG